MSDTNRSVPPACRSPSPAASEATTSACPRLVPHRLRRHPHPHGRRDRGPASVERGPQPPHAVGHRVGPVDRCGDPAAPPPHDPVEVAVGQLAADPERHAGVADRARAGSGCPRTHRRGVDVHRASGPERRAGGQLVVEQLVPPLPVHAQGAVLLLLPAGAHAEDQPSPAEHVEGRRRLGQQGGRAQRRDQHRGAQLDPLVTPLIAASTVSGSSQGASGRRGKRP